MVSDAAPTLLPNLVSPVLLTVTAANAFVAPKASVKVTPPEPAVTVKLRAALLVAVSITLAKLTAPLVEVSVMLSVSVMACAKLSALPVPVTEILPPRLLAPVPD